jgi:hypothetical protein
VEANSKKEARQHREKEASMVYFLDLQMRAIEVESMPV